MEVKESALVLKMGLDYLPITASDPCFFSSRGQVSNLNIQAHPVVGGKKKGKEKEIFSHLMK